ncbi:Protein Star [Armadillidium vulgare]|nr:Protein Star [Armadillidium vulgare]
MSNTLGLEMDQNWSGLLVLFSTRSQYYNSKEVATYGFKMRSMNGLASYVNPILLSNSWFKPVQCFPLESLLLSLGVSKIDLLSLDVEGAEKDIIANFPFHKFRVEVIYVECRERFIFDEVAHELSVKGFRLFGQFKDDSVFVKNDTIYQTFTLH